MYYLFSFDFFVKISISLKLMPRAAVIYPLAIITSKPRRPTSNATDTPAGSECAFPQQCCTIDLHLKKYFDRPIPLLQEPEALEEAVGIKNLLPQLNMLTLPKEISPVSLEEGLHAMGRLMLLCQKATLEQVLPLISMSHIHPRVR